MKSSTKDNAKGKMHQANGKIKEAAGKIAGNCDQEAEGKVENLGGKVQEKVGQVEKVLGKQKGFFEISIQEKHESIGVYPVNSRMLIFSEFLSKTADRGLEYRVTFKRKKRMQ